MFNRNRRSKKISEIRTRQNPVIYAQGLIQAMGMSEATRVAGNTYGCAKSVVENLSVAPAFVDPVRARKDLGFWQTVYGYLMRRNKPQEKKGAGHAKPAATR